MDSTKPLTFGALFTERLFQAVSENGRGDILLQLGAPEFEPTSSEWLCAWNLFLVATSECISTGVSTGSDALQALLRSLQVLRAVLEQLAKREEVVFVWNDLPWAGVPDLGSAVP